MLQLQPMPAANTQGEPTIVGAALCVAFADKEALAQLREAGAGVLELDPPVSMSDEDCYLVVPSDIGVELIDILRDADLELLSEALNESLIVVGEVHSDGRGGAKLDADWVRSPAELIASELAFAAHVEVDGAVDELLAKINRLGHVQCTMLSAFFDADGLRSALTADEFAGISWRLPASAKKLQGGVEPTYVWTRRAADGSVAVELALFVEDDELIALLKPLSICP